ncbi:MAG: Mov34/MPN/PAD-1 family protein [Candidatus Diapherotrites archaeon]|nr:Mov34/MPN/PAD-1 family protein [Candidatus Diapherotrites archaeon]
MFQIKRAILEGLLDAAKHTYPNEFFALLGSKHRNEVVDEVVIVPAVFGKEHSIMRGQAPVDFGIIGSVYSHPGASNRPSPADVNAFPHFGKVHFIISFPFNIGNAEAYDVRGKKIEWGIIE